MPDKTILTRLLSSVDRWPERIALEVEGNRLTYRELFDRAGAIAATLDQNTTTTTPPITAVLGHRSLVSFTGVLAALLRGHGYLPLSPLFPADRLRHILTITECRNLIVDDAGISSLYRLLEGFEHFLHIVVPSNEVATFVQERWPNHEVKVLPCQTELGGVLATDIDPQSIAYILFTSGSTGVPKGVQVSHNNVLAFLDQVDKRYDLGATDRMSQTFELTFDLSVFDMFVTWCSGGCLCCPSHEHLLQTDEYITHAGLTSFFAVPSLGAAMERHNMLRSNAFPLLRLCLFCGEPFPASLAEAWRRAAPNARIENVYGPTELTIFCTAYEWAPSRSTDRTMDGIVSIGHPLSGMKALVVDESLTPVITGESGELLMAGPQVTLGYWKDVERTENAFVVPPGKTETYYRTGDRVRQEEDDGVLFYVGRFDNQIQVHGYRVELAEVEAALREAADTSTAVALGWPESEIGYTGIVAFIADQNADLVAIRHSLAKRLPTYMLPSEIRLIDEFPRSSSGKIDHKELRVSLLDNNRVVYAAPDSPIEKRIAEIWSGILDIDRIGVNDSFFDLGGDSIAAAKFINELHTSLGEIFHVASLFERRTIAEFAAYLKETCPEAITQVFEEVVDPTENIDKLFVSQEKIADMRSVLDEQHGCAPSDGEIQRVPDGTCSPVFILCAPRSGSTLLRIMMAGHPSLFAPPELELAAFDTLSERTRILTGLKSWRSEGLVRALMELRSIDPEEALALLQKLTEGGCTTKKMYQHLQKWSERIVVDKTTTYALSESTLGRMESSFNSAKYVHLIRHPAASIDSYCSTRMEAVFGQTYPYSAREQAELIWLITNENIQKFLRRLAEERSLVVYYEQLVLEPEKVMRQICDFVEIEYDDKLLVPYEGDRMTDGLHPESRMLGDMRFHEHKEIDAAQATKSNKSFDTLSSQTRFLAKNLGYEDIVDVDTSHLRAVDSAFGKTIFPFKRGGRKIPLFVLPDASGNPLPYKALADKFDPDRPLLGLESPDRYWRYDILSIPDQVAYYYVQIRTIQPTGPYCLGGWCMGGALAFEIARRLEDDGEQVQSLVLFDVRPPDRARQLMAERTKQFIIRSTLLKLGRIGDRLVNWLWFTSNAAKMMACMPEGPCSDTELRKLLMVVSGHELSGPTVEAFDYHQLYDELATRLDLGEAYMREFEIAKLTVPPWLHPVRLWHVWFKHTIHYRRRYRPSGIFHGKMTLLLNDSWEHDGWQRFCSQPIDVRQYPIEPFDRGVFSAFMLPPNVALFEQDLVDILGDG